VLNPEEPRVFDLLSRAHGALDDQQIAAWLAEARARLAEGAFTRADALVQQSLERRPALPEAQALRREIADARQAQEQIRERQRAVAHAVERARAHMAAGALDAVVRATNEALAFEPDHPEAQALKQQALDTLEAQRRELEHEQRASSAVAAAKVAVRAGDLEGAAALLDAFAPPHPLVTAARAEVERQIDARRKAIEQASAAKNAARAAITAGEWANADASLKQAASFVSRDPEIVELQRQLTDARTAAEEAARAAAERERLAREQAEREARENAEREAREQAERERLAREEADRKAREKAEQEAREKAEREAREQAERERLAREEADRKAREKAEQEARENAEREAREQAERERLAREEADRKAREKAEQDARQKAERAAREKAERERLAREEADRKAREKAEQDARQKAERAAREKAERERLAREEADRKAREKAEQKAREKAERETRERRAREEAERLAREQADRDRLAIEAAERNARETSEREARARAEQEAREKAELESVDRAAREQRAREEALALSPDDETRPAGDRTSPKALALEAARQEALQRSAALQAEARPDAKQAKLPDVKRLPAPTPARAAAFPIKWAAVILIAGLVVSLAAFLILGRSRSGNTNATAQATPQSTTVSPADVLREVHRLANDGHPDQALDAAVKGYRATHDQVLAEYITSARTAAAKTASDAAGEASGTDAAKRAEYTDAAAKFQQAAALTSLEDAPRAVALYADAEKGYRAAVTASTNDPAVFVQKATDAYKNGALDRAVEYALTARRLDPSHAASDKLIDQIRRDATRETARARSAAVAAGAAGTDDFARAEKRARDASRTTSPDELLAQVTANKEAGQLYRASATAAENARTAQHQTAEQHAEQARRLIAQKRLDDAENELRQAKTAEPDNATAQAVDRQLADARRAAKADELNTRVTSLLQQSRGVDARQAIPLLQQASALDPSRDDVKRELQRRNDELNARPAPPVPAPNPPAPSKDTASAARAAHDADVAAILQVLERYWAAWDALDVDAIRAVYPSANARSLRDYFKNLKSQQTKVQPQTPEIDSSGTAATVRCRVTSHAEMRAGTVPDSTKNAVLSFAKVGGTWRIIGLQYL
jgi:hypothetical protein